MPNALLDIQTSLRDAIKKASDYTAGLERRPYAVSAVLLGGGLALTASHVVSDEGAELLMPGGGKARARLLGRDPANDLALLRLDSKDWPGADPASVKIPLGVGDLALALKRDPADGINAGLSMVSAVGTKLSLGRGGAVERYVQVSAERMPGSTGGPLADVEGRLAGVQVFNRSMGSEISIPADLALQRAKLLAEKGSIKRPYLGIKSQIVRLPGSVRDAISGRQETGLLVMHLDSDSAAARGGLQVGDILVGFGGAPVADHGDLLAAMAERGAGASVQVEISRGGALSTLAILIGGV